MSKIAYITVNAPYGTVEAFIIAEMLALKKIDANLVIIPRDKSHELFHKKANILIKDTLIIPWFDFSIAKAFLTYIIESPLFFLKIINEITFKARNVKIALKNLMILPKALYLALILKEKAISHIHAHWGTTTSTMAYISSKLTNIPWSLTLHRGDIKENNLLKLKVGSAAFTRCISEHGKNALLNILGDGYKHKISVIPMGVEYAESVNTASARNNPFTIVVPASLFLVKGHKYMIDACSILKRRGLDNVRCIFYGNGYLKNELREYIKKNCLTDLISMPGQIPNEELIELYKNGKIDAVVLPSINTDDGEHEGIPVSLMEAMSYGIPVISTYTGGIPELIGDGSGIIVREKDSTAIANAIKKLMNNKSLYNELSEKGKLRVGISFNISIIAGKLLNYFSAERMD